MDQKLILAGLEEVAERLGLTVRYERLGDDEFDVKSGRCRLKGRNILMIERRLDLKGRIDVLSRELRPMNLSGIFIKPFLRAVLEDADE